MEQTELREQLKKIALKYFFKRDIDDRVLNAMEDALSLNRSVPTKEVWELACKQTLNDIAITFDKNKERGDTVGDRDVFQAIAETITNFPLPDFDLYLKSEEYKQWQRYIY